MTTAAAPLDRNRQPKGVPVGGEFAPFSRSEGSIQLVGEKPAVPETVWTRWYDSPEEKVAAYGEVLQGYIGVLHTGGRWNAYLEALAKFKSFSFKNLLLIDAQAPNATMVATYDAWREKGRKPNRKGISIFVPDRVLVPVVDKDGEPVLDGRGIPIKEERNQGYTTATIFDVAMTEGTEPWPAPEPLSNTPPDGFIEDLTNQIEQAGFGVVRGQITDDVDSYTDVDSEQVIVQEGLTPEGEASALAHELGHIKAGHMRRVIEYEDSHVDGCGQFELEAESIGRVLCLANGMNPTSNRAEELIVDWEDRDDLAVQQSGQAVQLAVKTLLSPANWRNLR